MIKLSLAFSILLAFTAFSGFSQSKYDTRLLVKYSEQELSNLEDSNPAKFEFINYCIEHAFYVSDLPTEKMQSKNDQIGLISIENIEHINFFALNLNLIQDNYQFFAIEGHNKLLVIKSIDHITKEMQDE